MHWEQWAQVVEWNENGPFYLAISSTEYLKFIEKSTEHLGAILEGRKPENTQLNRDLSVQETIKKRADALCHFMGYEGVVPERFDPIQHVRGVNRDIKVISLLEKAGEKFFAHHAELNLNPGPFSAEAEWDQNASIYRMGYPVKDSKSIIIPHQVFHTVWCVRKLANEITEQQNNINLSNFDRPQLIQYVEEQSQNYAQQRKKADAHIDSDTAKILDEFKHFVSTVGNISDEIKTKQDFLSKIYYETLMINPSTDFLDILITAGFDPLHIIQPNNDLGIKTEGFNL